MPKNKVSLELCKNSLQEGECIVGGDFAEKYSFIAQDAAQVVHWNRDSPMIHPFIVYFKDGVELKSMSIALISDELNHSTVSVYTYQAELIKHINEELPNITKITYLLIVALNNTR